MFDYYLEKERQRLQRRAKTAGPLESIAIAGIIMVGVSTLPAITNVNMQSAYAPGILGGMALTATATFALERYRRELYEFEKKYTREDQELK